MKVAIMGAGMSGLSCAIMLERAGVIPDIYEKRSRPGDRFVNGESMFSIMNRPVKDGLKYLQEEFGIVLRPITRVHKLIIHSKNEKSSIEGPIGYTNLRGRHVDSFENQLAGQTHTPIQFNSQKEYEELCKHYDRVVVATGDGAYSSHHGNYSSDMTVTVRGATAEGLFQTDTPHLWFNYELLPKGYAWAIPFSDREANIVILYPDYPSNIRRDINKMWESMFGLIQNDLEQHFRITDKFEVTRYMLGLCKRPKVENTYYAGNCFGAISPGLGFGQFTSVLTGVYCAYDILGKGDYTELTQPLAENYRHSLTLRHYLESLDDEKLDRLVKRLDNEWLDGAIDRIFSQKSGADLLKWSTPVIRMLTPKENKLPLQ